MRLEALWISIVLWVLCVNYDFSFLPLGRSVYRVIWPRVFLGRLIARLVNSGSLNDYFLMRRGPATDTYFTLPKKSISHDTHIWARGRYWGRVDTSLKVTYGRRPSIGQYSSLPFQVFYKYNTTQSLKHEGFDKEQSVFRPSNGGIFWVLKFRDDMCGELDRIGIWVLRKYYVEPGWWDYNSL